MSVKACRRSVWGTLRVVVVSPRARRTCTLCLIFSPRFRKRGPATSSSKGESCWMRWPRVYCGGGRRREREGEAGGRRPNSGRNWARSWRKAGISISNEPCSSSRPAGGVSGGSGRRAVEKRKGLTRGSVSGRYHRRERAPPHLRQVRLSAMQQRIAASTQHPRRLHRSATEGAAESRGEKEGAARDTTSSRGKKKSSRVRISAFTSLLPAATSSPRPRAPARPPAHLLPPWPPPPLLSSTS